MYSCTGRNTATTNTIDLAVWALWNPSSTQTIKLVQWAMFAQSGGPGSNWSCRLQRISARGTPNNTVTPNISNHSTGGADPPSGALFDLGNYSSQPTILASSTPLSPAWMFTSFTSAGTFYDIEGGIDIPPGTGVAMLQLVGAVSVVFDNTVVWLEDWT